jgi:hypothetical protein
VAFLYYLSNEGTGRARDQPATLPRTAAGRTAVKMQTTLLRAFVRLSSGPVGCVRSAGGDWLPGGRPREEVRPLEAFPGVEPLR